MIEIILLLLISLIALFHYFLLFLFVSYIKKEFNRKYPEHFPKISLIMPCKGMEINLEENINSVLNQDYPKEKIEYIFAVAEEKDPALKSIKNIQKKYKDKTIKFSVSSKVYKTCAEKLSNMINAFSHVSKDSEVLVFLDSDLKIKKQFIKKLVQPLQFSKIGATTGYRYYKPNKNIISYIRSAYILASSLCLSNEKTNFTYGGATAIKKELFSKLGIDDIWRFALSDDFPLTNAVKSSGKKIKFVPYCIGISYDSFSSYKQLQSWINRQVKIMYLYDKPMSIISSLVYFSLLFLIYFHICFIWFNKGLFFSLVSVLLFLFITTFLTTLSIKNIINENPKNFIILSFLLFFVLHVFLIAIINSLFSRKVKWRGIEYIVHSPYKVEKL